MTLALIVYLVGMFSSLKGFLLAYFLVSAISLVFIVAHCSIEDIPLSEYMKITWVKVILATLTISSALFVITPSERTAYMMLGAYATQEIATSIIETGEAKNIGNNILKIIDGKIESFADSKEEK